MKIRILILSALLPFFLFAVGGGDNDGAGSGLGNCNLIVNGNGDYEIRCTGSGIFIQSITITNELCNCSLQDCLNLKNQLLSACSDVSRRVNNTDHYLNQSLVVLYQSKESLVSDPDLFTNVNVQSSINKIDSSISFVDDALSTLSGVRAQFELENPSSLYSIVSAIECGECSSGEGGVGGGCCDFSSILDKLNDIQDSMEDFYDFMKDHFNFDNQLADDYLRYKYSRVSSSGNVDFLDFFSLVSDSSYFADYMYALTQTTVDALPSLNNYLYLYTQKQVKPVYDTIHHKSFMYYMPSGTPSTNYFSYITNFYMRSAFGKFTSSDGNLQDYTNWFDRVEALLAALVFTDSSSLTNLFSGADSQHEHLNQELLSKMTSATLGFTERVAAIQDTSQGIISSLSILSQGFSSFSQLPNTVTLAVIPDFSSSSRSSNHSISFESSEMIYIINACRCATTLAWCIGGVWLLFIFVSWSYKQCYNLVVFVWGVFSSIFKSS